MRYIIFLLLLLPCISYGQIKPYIIYAQEGEPPLPSSANPDTVILSAPMKAFPTAYGGGASSIGGRGGVVCIVNTLDYNAPMVYTAASGGVNEYYSGGIKAILEADIGPRYVIFDVSGVCNANLPITYNSSDPNHYNALQDGIYRSDPNKGYITVAGQTAPPGGFTLYRGQIRFIRQTDIIWRHMTIRPHRLQGSGYPIGDDTDTTPIKIGAKNVILDHLSTSHGGDKAVIVGDWLDGYPSQNLTVQWHFAFDSATMMFSVDGKDSGVNDWEIADNISWLYNLSMSSHRTPNVGGGWEQLNVEVQNNVIQLGGNRASRAANVVYGRPRINFQGNYFDAIKNSIILNKNQIIGGNEPLIYSDYNFYKTNTETVLNGTYGEDNSVIWGDFSTDAPLPSGRFTSTSFYGQIPNKAPMYSPQQAKDSVLALGGANRYIQDDGIRVFNRDSYDTQSVTNFNNRVDYQEDWTGFTVPAIPVNTRPVGYYVSIIGIPEWFVQAHSITNLYEVKEYWTFPERTVWNQAGYNAIEMYLNYCANDYDHLYYNPQP